MGRRFLHPNQQENRKIMSEPKKCAHESCHCQTTETYCSEVCKDSKGVIDITCQCEHPGCADGLKL